MAGLFGGQSAPAASVIQGPQRGGVTGPNSTWRGNGGSSSPIDLTKILQQSQSPGPSGNAGMPQAPVFKNSQVAVPGINNTTTKNATLDDALIPDALKRLKGDMGAKQALDISNASQRRMTSGLLKEMQGNASRRGVAGTGAESLMTGNLMAESQRNQANSADQISYKAEQDRNAFMGQTANMALGSAGLQDSQTGRNIQQYQAQQQAAAQQQQAQFQQQQLQQQQYTDQANIALQQQRMAQDQQNNLLNILTSLI